jgi:uncharacterized protein (DUF302 family)
MPATRHAVLLLALLTSFAAAAGPIAPRDGWQVLATPHRFAELNQRVEAAVARAGLAVVNAASASQGAAAQGVTIPGNRVIGIYRNDFARRMLAASLAAGIEAPIRLYLTENPDGTATLSYRTPSAVFSPYFAEGGEALRGLAAELDPIFLSVARDAAAP